MSKKLPLVVVALLLTACTQANVSRSDEIVIQGSDTEVQLVSALVEAFTQSHPSERISVAGGGSAVGIAALINGDTTIANSSRQMKPEEIASAQEKGRNPQEFIVARDGLSVIIHASNPVEKLTVAQVGAIYRGDITNWKEVGGSDAPIVLYGRQSTSGTFSFFRDTVVKGDYADTMRQMEGTQAIVDAVITDTQAIGYAGVGYVADGQGKVRGDLKVIPIAATADAEAISPLDMEAVMSGQYPIFRRIYQYIAVQPAKGSLLSELLLFETSDEGQAIIRQQGFYPLTNEDIAGNDTLLRLLR